MRMSRQGKNDSARGTTKYGIRDFRERVVAVMRTAWLLTLLGLCSGAVQAQVVTEFTTRITAGTYPTLRLSPLTERKSLRR